MSWQVSSAPTTLEFAQDYARDAYKLLELNPEVRAAIAGGEAVTIKGPVGDEAGLAAAVLTTANKSYLLRKAENSNTLLLVPPPALRSAADGGAAGPRRAVVGSATYHLQLKDAAPRLQVLRKLLRPYRGEADDDAAGVSGAAAGGGGGGGGNGGGKRRKIVHPPRWQGYTTSELLGAVQCSPAELAQALKNQGAFELPGPGGRWHVLDESLMAQAFDLILALIVEHDWPLEAVPEEECVRRMADFPRRVVVQCLRLHAADAPAVIEGGGAGQGGGAPSSWRLDQRKVRRFKAVQILTAGAGGGHGDAVGSRAAGPEQPLDEFMESWAASLPPGVAPDAADLAGIAIQRTSAGTRSVAYFPEHQLSDSPHERFKQLFQARAKWTLADLEPYVSSLLARMVGVSQADLLLKYTRSSAPLAGESGVRLYSAR